MGKLESKTEQLNLFNEANYHHWGKNDDIPLKHLQSGSIGYGIINWGRKFYTSC